MPSKDMKVVSVALPLETVEMMERLKKRLGLKFSKMARKAILHAFVQYSKPCGRRVLNDGVPWLNPKEMARLKELTKQAEEDWENWEAMNKPSRNQE